MKGSVTFTVNSSNSLILGYLHFVKEGGASKQRAISVFQKLIQNLGLRIVIKMDEHLRAFLCKPFLLMQHLPADCGRKMSFALRRCCSSLAKGLMPQKCTNSTCTWHFSLPAKPAKQQIVLGRCHLRKKRHNELHFSTKISLEMKDEFPEAEILSLCSCEAA